MLLLDHNLPAQLIEVLQSFSIECDTTFKRGWQELTNGDLVSKARKTGFTCVLTKDKDFSKSAAKALKANPNFCVVLIILPQCRGDKYVELFAAEWKNNPILPKKGKSIAWPRKKN